jgi:digeranylgeranylglycerophospholipid reductase
MDKEIDYLFLTMMDYYHVIVGGGSISGLLAAREIANAGFSVLVLEEDSEVGTPEHCGGLVSISGIQKLGIIPSFNSIQNNRIRYAEIKSSSKTFKLTTEKQKVIVLDRRTLDKHIAYQAQKMGAEIRTRCSVRSLSKNNDNNNTDESRHYYYIRTSQGDLRCSYFVDARGVGSLIQKNRNGILQSAQYEVYASWIDHETIEVKFDVNKYPGFFAWVIPTGSGSGKVGVAGNSINAANALDSYLNSKGEKYSVIRKVYAPIWIAGPIENFVSARTIIIGDAAGQTKPTTAGGIYTCGMGGVYAGRAISNALKQNDDKLLKDYKNNWFSLFKDEFNKMLLFRNILGRLDNVALDELFSTISETQIVDISNTGDFDFHSTAISKILRTKSGSKIMKAIFSNEIRRLLS